MLGTFLFSPAFSDAVVQNFHGTLKALHLMSSYFLNYLLSHCHFPSRISFYLGASYFSSHPSVAVSDLQAWLGVSSSDFLFRCLFCVGPYHSHCNNLNSRPCLRYKDGCSGSPHKLRGWLWSNHNQPLGGRHRQTREAGPEQGTPAGRLLEGHIQGHITSGFLRMWLLRMHSLRGLPPPRCIFTVCCFDSLL